MGYGLMTTMMTAFLLSDRMFYYGEWSVWHSNLPQFMGPNKIMVNLFPHDELQISHKKFLGPFLYEKKWTGRYTLDSNHNKDVSLPSSMNGWKPVCEGVVHLAFCEMERYPVSLFGIGIDEIPLPMTTRPDSSLLTMDLSIVGNDDMYLTVSNAELQKFLRRALPVDKTTSYHLVRSIQNDQPKVNVPISTFIATQLLGTLMGYVVHDRMCH